MHVYTCNFKRKGEGSRAAAGSQEFSTMKTEMIVYNEHENSRYQMFENKFPEVGCEFQFSVERHITKELLFKNKKGVRGRGGRKNQKNLNCRVTPRLFLINFNHIFLLHPQLFGGMIISNSLTLEEEPERIHWNSLSLTV